MPAPRVAIIIPAYNAADYIEASVRSILRQSVGDFQLLVVNDGSTDRTGEILERLAREDGRITPITVANGGPAKARNLALTRVPAGTEYLMFCDADDELAPDALEYALEKGGGADLVLMGFSILGPDGSRADYCEPEQRLHGGGAPLQFGEQLRRALGKDALLALHAFFALLNRCINPFILRNTFVKFNGFFVFTVDQFQIGKLPVNI